MQLQEAILHGIAKSENTHGPGSTTVNLRSTRLPIDGRLQLTADNVLHIYGKTINGYGTFDTNLIRYQFPVLLQSYIGGQIDFVQFSRDTTSLISNEMSNAFFANGGYALFLRYTHMASDWLLIVMLKLREGTGVDQATLSLNETLSFDIDHLHEAARIDLAKWQSNTQPYLSFIKKRAGREDITKYFRQALGCTEYSDSKHHTEEVMRAVDKFSESLAWSIEQRNEARRRTYEYCEEKDREKEPVNIAALSARIFDQDPMAFVEYIRDEGFEVSDTFKPHRATYTRFRRIEGKVGNIKISFDVDDLLQQRVDYDQDENCLIIHNVSPELVAKIHSVKPNANSAD